MTPEERARKAVTEWRFVYGDASGGYDDEALENGIAAAIRAAVEEERERCAKAAEHTIGPLWHIDTADEIAAAIRNADAPRDAE